MVNMIKQYKINKEKALIVEQKAQEKAQEKAEENTQEENTQEENTQEIIDIKNNNDLRYLDLIEDIVNFNLSFNVSIEDTLRELDRMDLIKYFKYGYFF
jgi:glucan-binding YG repeat protein